MMKACSQSPCFVGLGLVWCGLVVGLVWVGRLSVVYYINTPSWTPRMLS